MFKKENLIAVFLTVMVITVLMLSGPASAITVGIPTDSISDTTPTEGDSLTFTYQVDIHTNDVVDAQNVTVNITDGAGSDYVCSQYMNGTEISCDTSITMSCTFVEDYTASAGYAYGYSASSYQNLSQSHGYQYSAGYGYNTFSTDLIDGDAELVCNVTWVTPSVSSDTVFTISSRLDVVGGYFTDPSAPTVTVGNEAAAAVRLGSGDSTSTTETTPTPATEEVGELVDESLARQLTTGSVITFSLPSRDGGSEDHTFTVRSINYWAYVKSATFDIASTPQTVTLNEGQDKDVDLDADGIMDINVKLVDVISSKLIDVRITSLVKAVPSQPVVESTPTKEAETTQANPIQVITSNWAWLWIIVALVILVIIYVVIRMRRE